MKKHELVVSSETSTMTTFTIRVSVLRDGPYRMESSRILHELTEALFDIGWTSQAKALQKEAVARGYAQDGRWVLWHPDADGS